MRFSSGCSASKQRPLESSLRGAIGRSKDARLSTGYGDEPIQERWRATFVDCFPALDPGVARNDGHGSTRTQSALELNVDPEFAFHLSANSASVSFPSRTAGSSGAQVEPGERAGRKTKVEEGRGFHSAEIKSPLEEETQHLARGVGAAAIGKRAVGAAA